MFSADFWFNPFLIFTALITFVVPVQTTQSAEVRRSDMPVQEQTAYNRCIEDIAATITPDYPADVICFDLALQAR